MIPITIGHDRNTQQQVHLDRNLFRTHFHLIGATGTGKTTAIHTMLYPLLMAPHPKAAMFIVDPMGNLSYDLLRWMANRQLCPDHVRDRLLYIEPAREDVVLPFNPLLHQTEDHLYYQVGRAVEIVLRGWASQNIEEMPRLRQWCFNSFFAVAQMGYPIAACRFLLRPGTDEHKALLSRLPGELQFVWAEIMKARGSEALRLLESTRNRLAPFFDSGILRRMFGSTESRFDVRQFIRDRRIVILNVASYNRLDRHIGHTIGGLAVNEILETAMTMSPQEVDPTYLLLDEFQFFVGPDLFEALPTVRQLGLRLILAHQSFSQLERGDIDLSGLIWQARSRLMFANDAEDADRIAHELATITYDPMKLKEILYSRKQRIAGHRKEWTKNASTSHTTSSGVDTQENTSSGNNTGTTRDPSGLNPKRSESETSNRASGKSIKQGSSAGHSEGGSETLVPIHEDFYEISNKTYSSFDEQRIEWAKEVRQKRTGEAFGKFKDDPKLYDLVIRRIPIPDTPATEQAVAELLDRNFALDFFRSANDVQQEEEKLRVNLLTPPAIVIPSSQNQDQNGEMAPTDCRENEEQQEQGNVSDPFR